LALKSFSNHKEAAKRATALAATASADNKAVAFHERESTAITFSTQTLAKDKWRQVDADAAQCQAAANHAAALVVPPLSDAAIKCIRTEFALCTALLDAIWADIAQEDTTHTALSPPMTPMAHLCWMTWTAIIWCSILRRMSGERNILLLY
jgi:hypothetical protein